MGLNDKCLKSVTFSQVSEQKTFERNQVVDTHSTLIFEQLLIVKRKCNDKC